MKHINLKHAIVLGLLLSTSAYSAVFAESLDEFKATAVDGKVTMTEDKTVIGDSADLGFGSIDNNSIYGISIDVSEGKTLTLTDVNVTNPTITGNGNIVINNTGNAGAVATGAGNGRGSITGNNVTITAAGSGLDAYGGKLDVTLRDTLDITADGIGIHAQADGENPNNASVINITADKLFVDASKQGIYLTNASVKQNIDIQLKNGAVITSTTTDGGGEAAIQNSNQYKGTLTINTEQGDISASGVYAGAWVTYGSETKLHADNNKITGGSYGILNNYNRNENENSLIEITAAIGNNFIEGKTGLSDEGGTIKLTAEDGINQIIAKQTGVLVSGNGSLVSMTGKNNVVKVSGETPASSNEINGIYVTDGGKYVIEKNDGNDTLVDVTGNEADRFTYGIRAEKGGIVDIDTNNFTLKTNFDGVYTTANGNDVLGIYSEQSNVDINAEGGVNITVANTNSTGIANVNGVYAETKDADNETYQDASSSITADAISIKASSTGSLASNAVGVQAKSVLSDATKAVVDLTATKGDIHIDAQSTGSAYGVNAADSAEINLIAENGTVNISSVGGDGTVSTGINADSIDIAGSEKDVAAHVDVQGLNTSVSGTYDGILAKYGKTFVNINATQGNNQIKTGRNGIRSENGADVQVTAVQGNNVITALDEQAGGTNGIYATNTTFGGMTPPQFTAGKYAKVVLEGKNNSISNFNRGIYEYANSDVQLKADEDNVISAKNYGIYSSFTSMASLTAGQSNYIDAGNITNGFGDAYAVYALDNGSFTGTTVKLTAGNTNQLLGAVYASGTDTTVQVSGLADENGNYGNSQYNYISSAAAIANAGDLNDGRAIISSLYAEDGAQISISGDQNVIRTYADNTNENQLERTVWAYKAADITIDGTTTISTDRYETSPNSLDIAIAAGTATGLKKEDVLAPVADRATVTVNYGAGSSISGDILSAFEGQVDINPIAGSNAGIEIKGNLLSGNNGILNVNLGNGGTLTGRADDYGDAGVIDNSGHGTEFFNPAFSSDIFKGGEVNLTMGDNSRWNVTGQSWITRINTNGENALINLVNSDTDRNENAHALTVYEMNGDAIFNMSLDADRTLSDMVYMKNAAGDYVVNVVDPVTQADMYASRNDGGIFDGLRFATVGKGSKASFRAITWDQGVNNIEYEVGTDSYDTSDENHHYDSSTGNGAGDTEKPGTDLVEGFFGSEGTPGAQEAPANGIMMMAARADEDMGTNTDANGTEVGETTNFKLIGVKSSEISDAGKTVVAMSRINYSNAVYMDRLNKRMGEARYIDGDEGLWVRMRHDRIGKSDAFRSMNTMMELGYDTRVNDREDGEHRQGVAIDYMRGTADYKNVAGEGDVRRGGIWFYDTWLGNKGHYTDYVLKFGRLSNDFELYTRTLGEKVTGDYSNFVYSASAEYGRKKDLGNNWYIEPQAQIQYAHVTDADYTTSQDTHVQLDAIDSLIGRVGFRLGKDVGEKSTFYIKADVLHEFLGDQDIEARDATGLLSTTYENEGTWYDIGLGFSHQFSKGTYMYLDMEKSIGNDNEDTYQFNFGMNWKV